MSIFTFKDGTEETDILEAMDTYGGSFVKQLAQLYMFGDSFNKAKLRETFSNYFNDYRAMIEVKPTKRWCENHPRSIWGEGFKNCAEGFKKKEACKEGK